MTHKTSLCQNLRILKFQNISILSILTREYQRNYMGKIYPKAPPSSPVAASSESRESPSITVLGTTPHSNSKAAFSHWPAPAKPYDIPGLSGRIQKTFEEPEMMAEIRKANAARAAARIQLAPSPLPTPRKKKPPETNPCCSCSIM